jgi:hypothetical protein
MAPMLVREVIGVYDADGSWRGELAYVLGRLTGRAHCALCDITHGGLRRRPGFDVACARLGVPVTLLHRDEQPPVVAELTRDRTPIVLGRTDDGPIVVLTAEELARCGPDPAAFVAAIQSAIAVLGLQLAS